MLFKFSPDPCFGPGTICSKELIPQQQSSVYGFDCFRCAFYNKFLAFCEKEEWLQCSPIIGFIYPFPLFELLIDLTRATDESPWNIIPESNCEGLME